MIKKSLKIFIIFKISRFMFMLSVEMMKWWNDEKNCIFLGHSPSTLVAVILAFVSEKLDNLRQINSSVKELNTFQTDK